ncbi:MAG: hypothetical protein MUQ10_17705 [Anaerolineae bacterium]|nr:hypothetical protein [Anaerolineae bacterium]
MITRCRHGFRSSLSLHFALGIRSRLPSDFEKEILTERKDQISRTISGIDKERAELEAQPAMQTFTNEQIQTIIEFAQEIGRGLATAGADRSARRHLIELLDVRATLVIEAGERIVRAKCILGESDLSVGETNT